MKLTSHVERERRLAQEEALRISQGELEKQIDSFNDKIEGARAAARLREKEIRATVARTAREARSELAEAVYATLTPLVGQMLQEPTRVTTRKIVAAWQSFKDRCLDQTGRPLSARPIVNIMIGELAPGVEGLLAAQAQTSVNAFLYSLNNNEGALTQALSDGFNIAGVAQAFDAIEAEILRVAKAVAVMAPSDKLTARWEAVKTALSDIDCSQMLREHDPPPAVVVPILNVSAAVDGTGRNRADRILMGTYGGDAA